MLLARALVMAFGAKPVIVCPDDSVQAIEKCAAVVGPVSYTHLAPATTWPHWNIAFVAPSTIGA